MNRCKASLQYFIIVLLLISFFVNFEIIHPKKVIAVIQIETPIKGEVCNHSYSWVTTKAATCTTQGVMVYKCSKCSNISNTKQTSALGHNFVGASCTQRGTCTRCGAASGSALGHSYNSATCTAPKTCSRCGVTSGSALGHNFVGASCTQRGTCTRCGAASGSALGHSYKPATCTAPKTCSRCGATSGSALGHNYKAATCTEAQICTRCNVKVGGPLGHSYKPATCTVPKTCSRCGVTSGSALGHNYKAATCTEAQICTRCNVKVGGPLGHSYKPATCTKPKTCSRCGATSGSALGHNYKAATCTEAQICTRCNVKVGGPLGHSYKPATCTVPKTCSRCGATSGSALGHNYKAATCTEAQICTRCNVKVGGTLGHSYNPATCTTPKTCSRCGVTSGNVLDHSYKYIKKDEMYHIVKCSNCSYSYTSKHIFSNNKCNMCGYVKQNEIVVDIQECNHRYSWVIVKEATCTTSGTMVYKCSLCSDINLTKKANALGHNYIYKEKDSNYHYIRCGRCEAEKVEEHKFNSAGKCICNYLNENYKKCKNKILEGHNAEIRYGEAYKTQHQVIMHCKDCDVDIKMPNEAHKFDTKGKCSLCGYINTNKATCTTEEFVKEHKTKTSYKQKVSGVINEDPENKHCKLETCGRCKVSHITMEEHTFNEKGICDCKYKDLARAKCTEKGTIKDHEIEKTEIIKLNNMQHTYTPVCKTCGGVKSKQVKEKHIFNTKGECICGYVDINKASKGYTRENNKGVKSLQRIQEDSKVILLAFGGDGEQSLGENNKNIIVNHPELTESCNYMYVGKPGNWKQNEQKVIDATLKYVKEATGCDSLEEVQKQGYQIVLYGFSSGGEMLDPVWNALHDNGITPVEEFNIEGAVRNSDTAKPENVKAHAEAGTNVTICSVTGGAKDSISDRTKNLGESLDGTRMNGTIEYKCYVPEEGSGKTNYRHGEAGERSVIDVVSTVEKYSENNDQVNDKK